MFRFLLTLGGIVLWLSGAIGQPLGMSLEEAINKAVEHSYTLKNRQVQQMLAGNELSKTQAGRKPKVSIDGDIRFNPLLPTSVIPGDAFSIPGQPAEADKEVQFGTLLNASVGLNASYSLWDPAYALSIEIHKSEAAVEAVLFQKEAEEVKLGVAEAYYTVILRQEQVALAAERLRRAEDILAVTRTRASAGTVLGIEVQKGELEVQTAKAALEQSGNNLQRSRLDLARWIGISPDELPALAALPEAPSAPAVEFDPKWIESRPVLQAEQLQLQINGMNQQLEKKRYLPRIDLYGNLSAQHLSDDMAIWKQWFPFAYAGVRTSFTLFDGQRRNLNQESYQLRAIANQNQLSKLREDISFDIKAAALDLSNAGSQLNNARQTLDNARAVSNTEQTRYREGRLPFNEWRNTEFSLREAESAALNSRQAYLLAELRWRKASGRW